MSASDHTLRTGVAGLVTAPPAGSPAPDPVPGTDSPDGDGVSLKRLVVTGALWSGVLVSAGQVIRFGSSLILTRIFAPEVFGLMTIVNLVLVGLEMLSDLGVQPAVVQNRRGDEEIFLNTAWTIQTIRGVILFLISCVAAWPVALIYEQPALALLIPAAGATTIFRGFNATTLMSLRRHLRVRTLSLLELTTQLTGTVATVVWAWYFQSIWALVAGGLVGGYVRLIGSFMIPAEARCRFVMDRESARAIIKFGKWVFIATPLTYAALNMDRILLGKMEGMAFLGVFAIAHQIATIFDMFSNQIQSLVIFPAIAKRQDLPREQLRAKLVRARWKVLPVMALPIAVAAVFGDLLVEAVYPPVFHAAGWMLCWLVAGRWIQAMFATNRPALGAIGHPEFSSLAHGLRLVMILVGLPLIYGVAGIPGVVALIALSDLPTYIGFAIGLHRHRLAAFGQDFVMTLFFALALGVFYSIRVLLIG